MSVLVWPEKRSVITTTRFVARALAADEQQSGPLEIITQIKKQHYQNRHHCLFVSSRLSLPIGQANPVGRRVLVWSSVALLATRLASVVAYAVPDYCLRNPDNP